jgi:hypothetical protein
MRVLVDPARCPHDDCFVTMAYVPAGSWCAKCNTLVSQEVPLPPELLGYLSADWAWHLRGNAWTTQEPMEVAS